MSPLTETEVEGLMNEYIDINAQIKELKARADGARKQFTEWLDDMGAKKVTTAKFKAVKTSRKGQVDVKQIQIAFAIPDADLEKYRKPETSSWRVSAK